jgi:hypothetical protein
MVIRRKRSCKFLHEWCMRRTWPRWLCANYRLGDTALKAQSCARRQDAGCHYTRGTSGCAYFEHTSSTDCAFSVLPVFCLLFRPRISFQPFGWPQS